MTVAIDESRSDAGGTSTSAPAGRTLTPGCVLSDRYDILETLGQGGMGTVYKAHDRELDRTVAIKVIRPDLAGHSTILERFKQELILARQITHKNVIRIFDLGSSDAVRYITMEFIDGRSLASIMDERRLTIKESVNIVRQMCAALDAAHCEGVVHRDLKPQNVMIDSGGKVVVMDFGLARSVESANVSHTRSVLGTPGYMSPEQVHGAPLDARSDLFAVGIILYELVTGRGPYAADTVVASLVKRTQELPPPPASVAPDVPEALSAIIMKCLAIDREQRFASAAELQHELEAFAQGRAITLGNPSQIGVVAPRDNLRRRIATVAGCLAVIIAAGVALRSTIFHRAKMPVKPVTVLVADFINLSGDPVFDGTIEPMLNVSLEGAGFISSFNRGQAHRLAAQLQPGATRIDDSLARLIAGREGLNVVVSGLLSRQGNEYVIQAKATDTVNGKVLANSNATASTKEGVLNSMAKIVAPIREALGDVTPASAQIAAAETFTAASVDAAHHYSLAQDLLYTGNTAEAISEYNKALESDPKMGRAYSGLAVAHLNLGHRAEAGRYYKMALARIDRMTDREKYRTRGGYYVTIGDQQKATEEFSALVDQYPADTAGHGNLAIVYVNLRNMKKALEEAPKAVAIYPRHVTQRNNLALIAAYAGDFPRAAREAAAVLALNAAYGKGYLALAFSQEGQNQIAQAQETYHRLEKISAWGASYAASGLADLAIYEGRLTEARNILAKAIDTDIAQKDSSAAADKLLMLASAESMMARKPAAIAAVERALSLSQDMKVRFSAALLFIETGQTAKARSLAEELATALQAEPQALAKILNAELEIRAGNARRAIALLNEANKLLDTWIGRFTLGRAYLEAAAFAEADSEFDLCLKRRGEATTLFLDEVPTFRLVAQVYYYLGKAQAGLKSSGAADSFKTYVEIKSKGGEDPLLADARRLSSL